MPLLKKRSRIVSFRLSDEEYDSLKSVSATNGARSVSEFTRSAAFSTSGPEKIEDTLRSINERIKMLDQRLEMLTETLKGGANSATHFMNEKTEDPAE